MSRRADLEFGCRQHRQPQPGQRQHRRQHSSGNVGAPTGSNRRQPELGQNTGTGNAGSGNTGEWQPWQRKSRQRNFGSGRSRLNSGTLGTPTSPTEITVMSIYGVGTRATSTLGAGIMAPSTLGSETPAAGISVSKHGQQQYRYRVTGDGQIGIDGLN